jgi:predicted nuclease of predicted toxin-antitoxin system
MTLNQSALLELTEVLRSADGGDLIRQLALTMLQALVDAEATARIGAGPHERTDARITQRNGTREKIVSTTSGDLTVKDCVPASGVTPSCVMLCVVHYAVRAVRAVFLRKVHRGEAISRCGCVDATVSALSGDQLRAVVRQ